MLQRLVMTSAPVRHWCCLECRRPLAEISGSNRLRFPDGVEVKVCRDGLWIPCQCGQGRLWRWQER